MREHGLSFDHNLHALRIVEDFEQRYAAFRGLNLTFEVREGIIKHSRDYPPEKFPELSEYLLDQRPPLEAQLIDFTDEIAYNTSDLDDGLEAHLLSLDQIREHVPLFDEHYREAERLWPDALEKLKFNEALKSILDHFVGDLIRNTQHNIQAAGIRTLTDVRLCDHRLVGFSPETAANRQRTKEFLHSNLYLSAAFDFDKQSAEHVIRELFGFWIAHPEHLPPAYQERGEKVALARVVCDYIAGMTDPYIYEQYEKHCG